MRALLLLSINQYTKFEVPSFTSYKDIIGAKFKEEAQLLQRHRMTRYVSKCVLCFTSCGSYKGCKQQK